jgi:hypothetical protein
MIEALVDAGLVFGAIGCFHVVMWILFGEVPQDE